MAYILPGPKTSERLHAGKTLFRHGLNYDEDAVASAARGFIPPAQIILDRAEGDYVWDLDGNRYIDFQNGWATNPLGNCHPEVLQSVQDAHQRYGYHGSTLLGLNWQRNWQILCRASNYPVSPSRFLAPRRSSLQFTPHFVIKSDAISLVLHLLFMAPVWVPKLSVATLASTTCTWNPGVRR